MQSTLSLYVTHPVCTVTIYVVYGHRTNRVCLKCWEQCYISAESYSLFYSSACMSSHMEKSVIFFALLLLVWTSSSSATYYPRNRHYNYRYRLRCRNPGFPKNGYRIGSYFGFGHSVRYGCRSGYRLVGSSKGTCIWNKYSVRWSCSLPRCIRKWICATLLPTCN